MIPKAKSMGAGRKTKKSIPVRISGISSKSPGRLSTNISEFDRVLGNGFVSGQVILLAGLVSVKVPY